MPIDAERQKKMNRLTEKLLASEYRPGAQQKKGDGTVLDYLKARINLSRHRRKQKRVRRRIKSRSKGRGKSLSGARYSRDADAVLRRIKRGDD